MDSIKEIISTFSSDDVKAFRVFINRQKKLHARKTIDLFNILLQQSNHKPKEIVANLYSERNTEAYHALRKKLLRHIMDFLLLKQVDDDISALPAITGIIGLARYLFDNKKDILGWQFLNKAESLAKNNDYFDQLNVIYILQIEHAQSSGAISLNVILKKYESNKELANQNERIVIALSIVRQKLEEVRLSGQVIDFEKIINNVIDEYTLGSSFYEKPKLFFQFMTIFRSAVVAGKDYFSFEPFLLKSYDEFSKNSNFRTKDNIYRAGLLYMISHTLYRNKKFAESLYFLTQLKDCIAMGGKILQVQFMNKLILLSAANKFFQGAINEAISILENALVSEKSILSQTEILNTQLNLSFYYLYSQEPTKSNQTLISIFHSNKWCEKFMGKEWVLKKELIEVIIQYELRNFDIAINRIKSIESVFEQFIKQDRYARVKTYIGLIRRIIIDPEIITTSSFYDELEASFTWLPVEQEDLQAVMFYAWLKSKLLNRSAYEVLVELTRNVY